VSVVRNVVRGEKRYYYLVQTYRSRGQVQRKEKYLGTSKPPHLDREKVALERAVWEETWFNSFEEVRQTFQARRRKLPRSVEDKERDDFVIEFTYDTNRIEGSTLTFQETSDLLTHGVSPGGRPMYDIREAQLHADLLRRLLREPEPVDLPHLLAWHKAVFGETKPDIAGRLRDFEVRIRGSNHIPPTPLEVRPMLVELLRSVNRHPELLNPVERAGLFHFRFEDLHPFGDGNGRIGRLAMNMFLYRDGYPMLNVRYGKREGYYRALERSSLSQNPRPFLLWFFRRYLSDQRWWFRRGRGSTARTKR
jgi:Fic family protein